jgi:hypothetical protein
MNRWRAIPSRGERNGRICGIFPGEAIVQLLHAAITQGAIR